MIGMIAFGVQCSVIFGHSQISVFRHGAHRKRYRHRETSVWHRQPVPDPSWCQSYRGGIVWRVFGMLVLFRMQLHLDRSLRFDSSLEFAWGYYVSERYSIIIPCIHGFVKRKFGIREALL